jgi:hypothetical protein
MQFSIAVTVTLCGVLPAFSVLSAIIVIRLLGQLVTNSVKANRLGVVVAL